ncbi:MAG: pilO [Bacteriovoracaceae bacterium]|nr:pilO [Bacteriovoracaceae bacterium]
MVNQILDKLSKVPLWQKIAVLVGLGAVIPIFFYFMSWQPIAIQVTALQSQYQELDRKYKEQKAVADDLLTFQQNTKKLEEDLRLALTQLPREKEIPSLLRDIYTLGKKSGVVFKTFQPQGEVNKSLYAEVPIKLSLTGSYHEVAVFFDRIGKLSRIVNISELVMASSKGESDSDVVLTVDCVALTFMFLGARI